MIDNLSFPFLYLIFFSRHPHSYLSISILVSDELVLRKQKFFARINKFNLFQTETKESQIIIIKTLYYHEQETNKQTNKRENNHYFLEANKNNHYYCYCYDYYGIKLPSTINQFIE